MITLTWMDLWYIAGGLAVLIASSYAIGHIKGFDKGLDVGLHIVKDEPYEI